MYILVCNFNDDKYKYKYIDLVIAKFYTCIVPITLLHELQILVHIAHSLCISIQNLINVNFTAFTFNSQWAKAFSNWFNFNFNSLGNSSRKAFFYKKCSITWVCYCWFFSPAVWTDRLVPHIRNHEINIWAIYIYITSLSLTP